MNYKEYIDLLEEKIIKNGVIEEKFQRLVLIGMDAVTYNEKSMLFHTENGIKSGLKPIEMADALLAAIVTRGLTAWLVGIKAIEHAEKLIGEKSETQKLELSSISNFEETQKYFSGENGNISKWLEYFNVYKPAAGLYYGQLRDVLLRDFAISRKIKEFVIIALNLALDYKTGLDVHIAAAYKEGATKEEIETVFQLALIHKARINFN